MYYLVIMSYYLDRLPNDGATEKKLPNKQRQSYKYIAVIHIT